MNIAFLMIITACGNGEKSTQAHTTEKNKIISESQLLSQISETREENKAKEKTVSLALVEKEKTSQKTTVSLVVHNPQGKPLQSVRSFLSFPTDIVYAESVVLRQESPFSIAAPREQNADNKNGIIKIGVSTAEGKTTSEKEIHIADITFTQKTNSPALIDFYRSAQGNETAVYQKKGNELFDALLEPDSPALLLFSEQ